MSQKNYQIENETKNTLVFDTDKQVWQLPEIVVRSSVMSKEQMYAMQISDLKVQADSFLLAKERYDFLIAKIEDEAKVTQIEIVEAANYDKAYRWIGLILFAFIVVVVAVPALIEAMTLIVAGASALLEKGIIFLIACAKFLGLLGVICIAFWLLYVILKGESDAPVQKVNATPNGANKVGDIYLTVNQGSNQTTTQNRHTL